MSSPGSTFTYFSDLPLELQMAVWKLAIHASPPLTVDRLSSWRPWGVPITATITGKHPGVRFPHYIMDLPQGWAYGQTCRLARLIVLEWWKGTLQKCRHEDHRNSMDLELRVVRILGELIDDVRGRLRR